VGRPLWREDGSVFCICCWPLPAQSFSGWSPLRLATVFYCLRLPFSSPPTTRRVTVEVFDPASTREYWTAPYIGSARTTHRKHISFSATDIMNCCQTCPPMHCLVMEALLLRIRCCDTCLPVCYLATLWANPLHIFSSCLNFKPLSWCTWTGKVKLSLCLIN
jgi:hypothetical protein